MPKYTVTDPTTGKKVTLTGDSPPTEQELEDIFASVAQAPAQPKKEAPAAKEMLSIGEINKRNAEYVASPQRATDKASYDSAILDRQKQDFAELPAPARAFIGAGASVAKAGRGLGQIMAPASDVINPRQGPSQYQQSMQAEQGVRNSDFTEGDTAASVGKFGADVAMFALPMSKLGGATKLAQYGGAAGVGAGVGALQPVTEGDSRIKNTAVGGTLGAVGQGASNALIASGAKAGQIVTPELRNIYNYAKSKGLNLTPAQLSDSGFIKRLSMMTDRLPFSGANKRNSEQQLAGNAALSKLIGQDSPKLDAPTLSKAADDLGTKFENVFEGGVKLDRKFLVDLFNIKKDASLMDDSAQKTVDSFIDRIRKQAGTGQLPAKTLQSLDMQIRKFSEGAGDRASVSSDLRKALHSNFGRNAPAGKKETWDEIRKQWATLKTLEPLVARNPEGGVPMQQIAGAINATKKGRAMMARDNAGEFGTLAKVGQRMKGPSTSGTAENIQSVGIGGGLVANAPLTIAAMLGGKATNSALNSQWLAKLLMRNSRGNTRTAIAPYARTAAVAATPSATEKTSDVRRK